MRRAPSLATARCGGPRSGRRVVHHSIAASTEAVWAALTDDIGLWWPEAFYAGGEEGARSYHREGTPPPTWEG